MRFGGRARGLGVAEGKEMGWVVGVQRGCTWIGVRVRQKRGKRGGKGGRELEGCGTGEGSGKEGSERRWGGMGRHEWGIWRIVEVLAVKLGGGGVRG